MSFLDKQCSKILNEIDVSTVVGLGVGTAALGASAYLFGPTLYKKWKEAHDCKIKLKIIGEKMIEIEKQKEDLERLSADIRQNCR